MVSRLQSIEYAVGLLQRFFATATKRVGRCFSFVFWSHAEKLSAIVTIIGLPLIVLGSILAWFQLEDYLVAPEVRLEFVLIPGGELCVLAKNPTARQAKGVSVPVSLWLDSWTSIPEVPLRNFAIHPHDYHGPNNLTRMYGLKDRLKNGDHLFGIAFADCPECEHLHYYWLYFQEGGGGWYAEAPDDWAIQLTNLPPGIKSQGLAASASYLVPNDRRKSLEEKVYAVR